jgi:hypothetical protein
LDGGPLSEPEIERLAALRLDHVRHDARLAHGPAPGTACDCVNVACG